MVRCTVIAACLIWISVNFVPAQGALSFHNAPTTSSPDIFTGDHIEDSIRLALANHVICPHGWSPAMSQVKGLNEPICLRITRESQSWGDARDVCRQNKGFLVKVESDIHIGSLSMNQFLDERGIQSYWTGLHEDDSKLIWDEMRPSVVQTFVGQNAGLGELKRGWSWNKSTLDEVDDSCGMVLLKHTHDSSSRKRRSDGNNMGFTGQGDSDDNIQDQPEMKNHLLFESHKGENSTPSYVDQFIKRQQEASENKMTVKQTEIQSDITTQVPSDPQTTEANGNDDDSPDPSPESNKEETQDVKLTTAEQDQVSTPPTVPDTTSLKSEVKSTPIVLDTTTNKIIPEPDVEATTQAPVVTRPHSSTTTSTTALSKETSTAESNDKSASSGNSTSDSDSNESGGNSTVSLEESVEDVDAITDAKNTSSTNTNNAVTRTANPGDGVEEDKTSTSTTYVNTRSDAVTQDTTSTTTAPVVTTTATTPVVTTTATTPVVTTTATTPSVTTTATTPGVTSTAKPTDSITLAETPTTSVVMDTGTNRDKLKDGIPSTTKSAIVTDTTSETVADTTKPTEPTTTQTVQNNEKSLTSRTRRYTSQTHGPPNITHSPASTTTAKPSPVTTASTSAASTTMSTSTTSTSVASTSTTAAPTSTSTASTTMTISIATTPTSSSPPPPTTTTVTTPTTTTASPITSTPTSSGTTEDDSDEDISDDDFTTAATEKTYRTTSPTTLHSTATHPPKKESLQFSYTIVPARLPTSSSSDYITELAQRIGLKPTHLPVTPSPRIHHSLEASMNLEECSEKHASVCYKTPVQFLKRSLLCGPGWLGHPDVDKCYKVSPLPMTFYNARKGCIREGGVMALADSDFHGNTSALALLYHRTRTRIATSAWVDVQYTNKMRQTGRCTYLDGFKLKESSCDHFLPVVCEKPPQYFLARDDFPSLIDDDETETRFMLSSIPGSLLCPLTSSSPEQEITWVKDGTLIPESRPTGGYGENFRGRHLRLDAKLMRRLGQKLGKIIQPSLLQGVYRCQLWANSPFRLIKSNNFLVVFTDVITLHGVAQTRGIPLYDAALLNHMDTASGIPVTMAHDLSAINHNISRSLYRLIPELRDVVNVVKSVDVDSGEVSFYTYIGLRDPILDDAKTRLVTAYLQSFQNMLQEMDAEIAHDWNMKQPVVDYIRMRRTDACSPSVLKDSHTGYRAHFQATRIGERANSVEICGAIPAGFAFCKGDHLTGAYWDAWHVASDCKPRDDFRPIQHSDFEPIIPSFNPLPKEPFIELDEVQIEDANVVEVTDKLANILEKTSVLTEADIDACAKVIKRIVDVNPRSDQVGKQLISTVNKILDVGDNTMEEAEKNTKAASIIINNLEEFAMKAKLGTGRFARFVTPNIALEMWDLEDDMKPVIGLGAKVADDWNTPLSQPRILTIRDRSDDMLVTFDVAIELPMTLVRSRMNASTNTTRLSMLIYRKVGLFSSATPLSNTSHGVINSAVIAASLGGKKIVGLKDKVRLVFRPFVRSENHLRMTKCVFWDFSRGGWSDQGCYYNGSKYGKDICLCDHLTNFAILLDFYGTSMPIAPEHELTLSIITLVGLGLSILGLSLTIISFVFFKKLRKGRAQLTLFNMALALVAANLVFLVGIKQTANYVVCLAVSMLMHYLILVAFMWMLVEAVLQYFTFVKVLNSYISRYALKSSISAWGLPLVPVIAVVSIDYTLYRGRPTYCWLGMEAFYYAFALPVGAIILINIVMFVVVLVSIIRRPDGLRNNQSKHKRASTNLKAAITVFVLLGLTWIFGYLAIEDARLTFQYVFTLLSSLQGFFIFILMVARRPQVREQWKAVCCKTSDKGRTPKNVSPTNSNSASSRGSDASNHSNGSSRPLVATNSVTSMISSCGNGSFASNSFVNRSFSDGYDSVYNVHPRRNTPYQNLQDKPPNIKE